MGAERERYTDRERKRYRERKRKRMDLGQEEEIYKERERGRENSVMSEGDDYLGVDEINT